MMEGVGVSQDIDTGEYGRRGSDVDEYHPETVTAQGEVNTKMFANPFAPSSTVGEPSGNRSIGDSGGQSGSGSGTGRDGRGGFDGPVGALKRSQLGQLLDSTGKGVSQQVVVINSINQRANEIIMSYKQSTGDIVQIVQRQAQLMDRAGAAGMIDEAMRTEVEETCNMMMDFCSNMVTKMEEAYGFIEGLPAVIEGDMGIYVKETTPGPRAWSPSRPLVDVPGVPNTSGRRSRWKSVYIIHCDRMNRWSAHSATIQASPCLAVKPVDSMEVGQVDSACPYDHCTDYSMFIRTERLGVMLVCVVNRSGSWTSRSQRGCHVEARPMNT